VLLPALGGIVGYRLAGRQASSEGAWSSPEKLREYVELMRKAETMAGAFAIDRISLNGVEKCYHDPRVDFTQVVWTGRDMPTPFVGFAPQPGPLPGGHINRQQFRYERDLDNPKPSGTCRIFLVGGSTAFGSGASTNETTVGGYLEKYLNEQARQYGCRFEVVTAAACGWASTHERILVENRLVEMEPDVVIVLSGHNDVFWGMLRCDINCYRAIQDAYYLRLANALLQSNFDQAFPEDLAEWHQPVSAAQSAGRLRRNVEQTQAALEKIGADYCFASQPILTCSKKVRTAREESMASRPGGLQAARAQAEMANRYDECRTALAGLKLPRFQFWDLTGVFDTAGDSDFFIDRCHFGDRGHDLIARDLSKRLDPILRARLKKAGQ
jgi:lysophospholipase L1-like esterase